jgi:signal transduction histidine kinase
LDAASAGGAPGGSVTVAAFVSAPWVCIEVRDSGSGVDALRLQALFEPGSSDKPGGMGIGLSICRAIVESHGGRLWAEAGVGGRFCFTLPLESHDTEQEPHAA